MITKTNLSYLYPANNFSLLHFMDEKICSHGTETNLSEHKMKCFLMDYPL